MGVEASQPGRAAYAARVAVQRAHESRVDAVREDVSRPPVRHRVGQRVDVRDAAAEHDDVRIEHVDDAGECARQAIDVAIDAGDRARVTRARVRGDLDGGERWTRVRRTVGVVLRSRAGPDRNVSMQPRRPQ